MVPGRSYDVIVFGAGFAGLSAAVRCARGGARVLVLEARARLGGRATAFTDRATGEHVDNGQHVLFGCYRATLELLSTIGARDGLWLQEDLTIPIVDLEGRSSRLVCPSLPAPFHLLGGVIEWDALGLLDRLSVARVVGPLRVAKRNLAGRSTMVPASPGETVSSWLVRNGQTPRLRALLWEPLALAALNQPAHVAAAPPFVRVVTELAMGSRRDSAVGLPLRPLDRFYAEPAREFIEARGGCVVTGCSAKVAVDGVSVVGAIAEGTRVLGGAVIAAVPWFALRGLMPDAGRPPNPLMPLIEATDAMAPSPIVTINLWLDRQVLAVPFVGLPGRFVQWVFASGQVSGGPTTHLSLVASGARDTMTASNPELIHRAFAELCRAWPPARAARLRHATVIREPRATFSLAPGQPARPSTQTPLAGFLLAGDWTDTGLPGTIESAVRSGHAAAAAAAGGTGA